MKSDQFPANEYCRKDLLARLISLFVITFLLTLAIAPQTVRSQNTDDGAVMIPLIVRREYEPICGRQIVEVGGNIVSSITWTNANLYVINSELVIKPGGSLTIQSGTVIKVKPGRGIDVEGTLTSNGNAANPVFWTSWQDDQLCGDTNGDGTATVPRSGDWGWIDYLQGSNPAGSIRYSVVQYGGRVGSAWRAPIRIFNVSPHFDYLTISNSHRNAVQLVGGNWTSQILTSRTVIYWLYDAGDLTVLPDNVMELSPGVKVKLGSRHGIKVQGTFLAEGTKTTPVYFSSEKDDALCGLGANGEPVCDTNDDRTASVPAAGDWKWIEYNQASSPNSSITNSILRYGGSDGHNWLAPIRIHNISPNFENLTIKDSYRNGVQVIGYDWTSQTLDSQTVIYWRYDGHLNVLPGNTLTILPGVKIKFYRGHGVIVNGTLLADGTQDKPIIFTSEKDDSVCGSGVNNEPVCDTNDDATGSAPARGDWQWIGFGSESDPGSSLTNAKLLYGGSDGHNWLAPIRIHNISPKFENLTIQNSYRNGVQLIGHDWTSQTLDSQTVIYWRYDGHLNILAANTLTIMPGVMIKSYDGHGIIVNGTLLADGTQEKPIIFTSEKDDTVCGKGVDGEPICDTNDDGVGSVPEMGNWQWIEFRPSSSPNSSLSNAILRYGGRTSGTWRAVVMLVNASPVIANVHFFTNHGGIYLYDNASPSLGCNDFEGQLYGAWNYNVANVVDMKGQWWGDDSGPSHATNPGGTGPIVGDGITFKPWATSPCTSFSP